MEQRFSISTTPINSCWETGNRPYRLFSWRSACVQYLTDLIIPSVHLQSDMSYHYIEIFFLPANSTSNTGLLSRSKRHQNYNLNKVNLRPLSVTLSVTLCDMIGPVREQCGSNIAAPSQMKYFYNWKYFWNIFQLKTIKTHFYSQLEDFQPCYERSD